MLRPDFVARKLGLIADELGRLAEFRDLSYEALVRDPIALAAVERMLERIVLRAVDVNEHLITQLASSDETAIARLSYRDTFLKLGGLGVIPTELAARIAPSAGLRNVLVHEYNDVDHRLVHAAIRTALTDYTSYVRAVNDYIARRTSE